MNVADAYPVVLAIGIAVLLLFALRLRQRVQVGEDFVLGRRRLTALLGGISLAMNGVPIWWLLILIGDAYAFGGSAAWVALALLSGMALVGWYLAPRLRARSQMQQCGTISQLLAGDAGEKKYAILVRSVALIAVVMSLFVLATQLQIATHFLGDTLGMSPEIIIVAIELVLCVLLLLSGFWIAVVGDVLQVAVFLSVGAVGVVALGVALVRVPGNVAIVWSPGNWFGDQPGLLAVSFLVGVAFLIGDAAGQSSMLARFMACKDDAELSRARKRALLWSGGMLLLALIIGWSARALSTVNTATIATFTDALSYALSPNIAAMLILLIFIAAATAMSNVLLAAASHLANDLRRSGAPISLPHARISVLVAAILAAALAIYLPQATLQGNFDRLLLYWHALGAAFGPLLIVCLSGKRVRPGSSLGAMWAGLLLTIVFYLMPDTPGDLLERGLPFTVSLGIALSGGERRRNPDRADRGERTIHDRLPI